MVANPPGTCTPLAATWLIWGSTYLGSAVVGTSMPPLMANGFRFLAAALILAYILLCLAIANAVGGSSPIQVIVPQTIVAILVYPLIARMVGGLDRARLIPFRDIG